MTSRAPALTARSTSASTSSTLRCMPTGEPPRASVRGSEYSGMAALHTPPQGVHRAKLKLFDRAFGFAEARRRFADAALFDEPLDDDRVLIRRKRVDKPEQARVLVGAIDIRTDAG